jgi:hypothetical protein
MNVLFYVHWFRDRDFWPIARCVVNAGNPVYYAIYPHVTPESVIAADRKLHFDLVISSDECARMPDGSFLNVALSKKPALFELAFDDLRDITIRYAGDDGSFSGLQRDRVCLGVMDRDLLESAKTIGVPDVVYFPYGVPPLAMTDPAYFARRWGKRMFGEIHPADLAPTHRLDRLLSRLAHTCQGYARRCRSTDVVFLGECAVGPDTTRLEYVCSRFLRGVTLASLLASDAQIREELMLRAESSACETEETIVECALAQHLPLSREGRLAEIGFLLLKEYYEQQVRAIRRLAYVRHLAGALGSRVELYGDHFVQRGLRAHPSDHNSTEQKYLRAKISIDFGSVSYGCCQDTRPSRIISCESLLLQLRRKDSDAVYGALSKKMTFGSRDEMLAMVNSYLTSAETAMATALEERALSSAACGMDSIVREFLTTFEARA